MVEGIQKMAELNVYHGAMERQNNSLSALAALLRGSLSVKNAAIDRVSVIFASDPAVHVAKAGTAKIPIVFVPSEDPSQV